MSDVTRNLKEMIVSLLAWFPLKHSFDAKPTKAKQAMWMCAMMHSENGADVSNDSFLSVCHSPSSLVEQMCWLFPVCTHRLCFLFMGPQLLFGAVVLIGLGVFETGFRITFYGNSRLFFFFFWCISISLTDTSRALKMLPSRSSSFRRNNLYNGIEHLRLSERVLNFFPFHSFFIVSVWAGNWICFLHLRRCVSADGDGECT